MGNKEREGKQMCEKCSLFHMNDGRTLRGGGETRNHNLLGHEKKKSTEEKNAAIFFMGKCQEREGEREKRKS